MWGGSNWAVGSSLFASARPTAILPRSENKHLQKYPKSPRENHNLILPVKKIRVKKRAETAKNPLTEQDILRQIEERTKPATPGWTDSMVRRIFIQNFTDLSICLSEIGILVTRVNDFKFCVNLGSRISNFAKLFVDFAKFQFFSNFVQKKLNIAIVLWVLGPAAILAPGPLRAPLHHQQRFLLPAGIGFAARARQVGARLGKPPGGHVPSGLPQSFIFKTHIYFCECMASGNGVI